MHIPYSFGKDNLLEKEGERMCQIQVKFKYIHQENIHYTLSKVVSFWIRMQSKTGVDAWWSRKDWSCAQNWMDLSFYQYDMEDSETRHWEVFKNKRFLKVERIW